MIIKLAPSVRLPYKQIKGSLAQRQQAAIDVVDKLYRKLYPKFDKNGEHLCLKYKKVSTTFLKRR